MFICRVGLMVGGYHGGVFWIVDLGISHGTTSPKVILE